MDKSLARKKVELMEFAAKYGLRDTWHEPNEQGVSARVTGHCLDNAFGDDDQKDYPNPTYNQEIVVHLFVDNGWRLSVNLADLLAIAAAPVPATITQSVGTIESGARVTGVKIDRLG